MNFVHLKIFGNNLNVDFIRDNLLLSPDTICEASQNINGMVSWAYSEETEDEDLNNVVSNLIMRIYEKKDFFSKLSDLGNDVYFVIAYYVESYQGIISLDSNLLSKLGEMKIKLIVDIMAP